jgi:HEAT repeat protein
VDTFLKRFAAVAGFLILAVAAYFLYDRLRARTLPERLAEIIHDEDQRELTDRLRAYLKSNNPELRARAALAVGRIGQSGSGQLLFEMVQDTNLDVAGQAAFALGLCGDKVYASRLMGMVNDLPASVAYRVVETVGRLADSSMTDVVSSLAGMLTHPSPDVRDKACMALYRAGAKSQGGAIVSLMGREDDTAVQKSALYALARLGTSEAAPIFVRFLADADPFVRSTALRGLGRSQLPEADQYLAIALNDVDLGVAAQAATELGRRDTPSARSHLAGRLARVIDQKFIVAIIQALQRQKNETAVSVVLDKLSDDSSCAVVAAGVNYLATVQKDRAVNMIDSLALSRDRYVRCACAEAYSLVGKSSVIPRLTVLFCDEDGSVRGFVQD